MKNYFIIIVCLFWTMSISAQETEQKSVPTSEQKGYVLDYRFVKDGWGLSATSTWFGVVNFGMYWDFFKEIDGGIYKIKSPQNLGFFAGPKYRYEINDIFFIEGSLGIGWNLATSRTEFKSGYGTTSESNSENNIFGYITPRVGAKVCEFLGKDLFVTIGYRMDFHKFKFSDDYLSKYFTIGVGFGF